MQRICPIIVHANGRTGSTLTMQLLATAKEIAVPMTPPFEDRYLFFLHALATLSSTDDAPMFLPDAIQQRPEVLNGLGYPLYHGFETGEFLDGQLFNAELQKKLVEAFMATVVEQYPQCEYYAEKSMGLSHPIYASDTSYKKIMLIRDPRDILCSVMSFNKKRKFNAFSWLDDDTELSYCKRMMPSFREMLSSSGTRSDDCLAIKYEALALRLGDTAKEIGEWLGVELSPEVVIAQRDKFAGHMTSSTAEQSVSKWKKQLSAASIAHFSEAIGSELKEAGYEE
ncbi:sulfotransferase [uncultured Pseudodesulfovibrio sp.]|uniref:sulfotransferase n=1 Tax=uncultured Pseudodesulfovibrio sp. TaxID=2035858 RepID=UPI0029C68993|nr:sulfotransferase [uncultured Pseudodesulfovibrio sp.]